MQFIPFFNRHETIAKQETRAVILSENNEWDLPGGEYGFVESFCSDDACDCHKAMIAIVSGNPNRIHATIGYGWESAAFYTKWLHGDSEMGAKMAGSYLESGAQQSAHSHTWLAFWKSMIASDEKYRERICRHYCLFKPMKTKGKTTGNLAAPEQYGTLSPVSALPDAEAELVRALRAYDIEKYVSIDRIRIWCEMFDAEDEEYRAPFAILLGFAAESKGASHETVAEVIDALRTFWNSLPRKTLGGNSPDEAFNQRRMQNKAPHLRSSVIEFARWAPHYDTALKQLHALGKEKTVLEEFRTVFRLLLEEQTTTRQVFRVFANAAIACFSMGDEYGGVRLLEIAGEINPHYDFAKDQMERYTSGKIDDLIIEGITRRDEEMLKSKHDELSKRRGTKNAFMHLRAISSLLGNFDKAKNRIPLAQIPLSKRDEREAKKAFEKEPWHAYYVFLKKVGVNFNHPLEEPSEVTLHRTNGMKIGRNDACPCGSGKKYKKCHGQG